MQLSAYPTKERGKGDANRDRSKGGASRIPVPQHLVAQSIAAADHIATTVLRHHAAIVLEIPSRKISHKSGLGGVALNLTGAAEVRRAARQMKAAATTPGFADQIDGYVLQPMVKVANGLELLAGLSTDAAFGAAVVSGLTRLRLCRE
ncbi:MULTISPECIES: acetate--CoA ligase family protein [Rhizobium]|nr:MULTISPECIES: acetate--CoA ligase family protein [Rhizobium]